MTIKLSDKVSGNLPRLAPDLTFPGAKEQGTETITRITGIDAQGSLTTVLSLTGKFVIDSLVLGLLTVSDLTTVKLTVDGVVIWNSAQLSNLANEFYIGGGGTSSIQEAIQCNASFLFEVQTVADTDIRCDFLARKIL